MEHICFEVQLCIKISIFKGIWNIDILIILCLGTSLHCISNHWLLLPCYAQELQLGVAPAFGFRSTSEFQVLRRALWQH